MLQKIGGLTAAELMRKKHKTYCRALTKAPYEWRRIYEKTWKKHLAMLLAAMLTFAAVWQWMPVGVREVKAEVIIEVDA
ncbi:MAG: hypothetical protein IIW54_07185, partial [Lachnospiraceae bacterium]|nr:hypothetical protein [Lachnospiraceae bacterium]